MKYTEEYITKNADDLNWFDACKNMDLTKMSDDLFFRFKDNISWHKISRNKTITTEFAHKHHKEIGYIAWFKDGFLHKEDGPAVIYPDGDKEWWTNGELVKMNY